MQLDSLSFFIRPLSLFAVGLAGQNKAVPDGADKRYIFPRWEGFTIDWRRAIEKGRRSLHGSPSASRASLFRDLELPAVLIERYQQRSISRSSL
jgi:hypothetical protein